MWGEEHADGEDKGMETTRGIGGSVDDEGGRTVSRKRGLAQTELLRQLMTHITKCPNKYGRVPPPNPPVRLKISRWGLLEVYE
jgi:hypothetical protein